MKMATIAKGTQPALTGTIQKLVDGEWKEVGKQALWDYGQCTFYFRGIITINGEQYHVSLQDNPKAPANNERRD